MKERRFPIKREYDKAPSLDLLCRTCLTVPKEENDAVGTAFDEDNCFFKISCKEEVLIFSLILKGETHFSEPCLPEYKEQDAIELYLATRPFDELKKGSRYCHVFLVFPEPVEGISTREVTEFRHGESRPRAEENMIFVTKKKTQSEVIVRIEIPLRILYGWEEGKKTVGFASALYRKGKQPVWFPHRAAQNIPHLFSELELS